MILVMGYGFQGQGQFSRFKRILADREQVYRL
jgi:hypothetical protein